MAITRPALRRGPAAPRTTDPPGPGSDGTGSARPAVVAVAALTGLWIVVFSVLVHLRQSRIWTVDYDMGIHDQSIWLLAHFRGFSTIRGLQVFGHHATVGYLLFVPFSWLGAGVDFLNISQVVLAALGVVPVFLLARFRGLAPWTAAALSAAYLLHPALQFFMGELFHPEVLAITPLLAAYYCSVRRRWGWFVLFVVLAVCWKEDVALFVVVLGLLVAWRGDRRVGLWTAGLAATWFLVWTLVIFPWLDHGAIQSAGLYADVGGTPAGMLRTALHHPGRITDRLMNADAGRYGWRLLAPFGLGALAAPLALVLAVPQFVFNFLTNVSWTKTTTFHYAALPLAAVTIASVEGMAVLVRRLRPAFRSLPAVVLVVAAVASTVAWGPSPVGAEYRSGMWAPSFTPRVADARAALAKVPGGASVSATYGLVPQLSERAVIYTFPNPWISSYFGVDGWPKRDPSDVDWLVVDETVLDPSSRALLDRLLAQGAFRTVFERDDFVVALRTTTTRHR